MRRPGDGDPQVAGSCGDKASFYFRGTFYWRVVISTGNDSAGYSELQKKLLALSTNSKQLMAQRSFHSVEIDEPEVVIRAIREVVDAVRGRRRQRIGQER